MTRLFLRHNGGHLIAVDGNVQIGRGRGERLRQPSSWFSDRPKPPDLAELDLVIDIDGSPYMSRNHAGIRCEGKSYTVQDLNSLNGTLRNDVRMEPGVHYSLAVGDCIAMGPDQFRVGDAAEAFEEHAFRTVVRPEWYLGVVGFDSDQHMQRVFHTSVDCISGELYRRGYQTELHGIKTPPIPLLHCRVFEVVQLSTILDSLNRRGYAAGTDAHTFLHYTGHGTREGLALNNSELLTPRTLFDAISSIRGKKFLVLDACHAGVFLSERQRIPPQTLILAGTRTADTQAFGDGPEETGLPMTILARRLWELLRDRSGSVDILDERPALETAFRQTGDGVVYLQQPGMNTATYTVCLRSVFSAQAGEADIDGLIRRQRARRWR
jgi:FHA domain-containing protein